MKNQIIEEHVSTLESPVTIPEKISFGRLAEKAGIQIIHSSTYHDLDELVSMINGEVSPPSFLTEQHTVMVGPSISQLFGTQLGHSMHLRGGEQRASSALLTGHHPFAFAETVIIPKDVKSYEERNDIKFDPVNGAMINFGVTVMGNERVAVGISTNESILVDLPNPYDSDDVIMRKVQKLVHAMVYPYMNGYISLTEEMQVLLAHWLDSILLPSIDRSKLDVIEVDSRREVFYFGKYRRDQELLKSYLSNYTEVHTTVNSVRDKDDLNEFSPHTYNVEMVVPGPNPWVFDSWDPAQMVALRRVFTYMGLRSYDKYAPLYQFIKGISPKESNSVALFVIKNGLMCRNDISPSGRIVSYVTKGHRIGELVDPDVFTFGSAYAQTIRIK